MTLFSKVDREKLEKSSSFGHVWTLGIRAVEAQDDGGHAVNAGFNIVSAEYELLLAFKQ